MWVRWFGWVLYIIYYILLYITFNGIQRVCTYILCIDTYIYTSMCVCRYTYEYSYSATLCMCIYVHRCKWGAVRAPPNFSVRQAWGIPRGKCQEHVCGLRIGETITISGGGGEREGGKREGGWVSWWVGGAYTCRKGLLEGGIWSWRCMYIWGMLFVCGTRRWTVVSFVSVLCVCMYVYMYIYIPDSIFQNPNPVPLHACMYI